MSFFSKVFGGKKDEKPPSTSEAIQHLREVEVMLLKKQEVLEGKVTLELQNAKKYGTSNKRAAIQALKRKKRYEKQLQQIDGTLATIEMQRETLEGANTNTAVLKVMKIASDALKDSHQNLDVDKVHDLIEDISEQQDVAREISDAISNPIGMANDIDEDELERELEELEQEELDKELLGTGRAPDLLPAVPVTPLPSRTKEPEEEEEEIIKELQEWAT